MDKPLRKVAFLGDYPPRQCGIATFTRDLRQAVASLHPDWECPVVAVSDRPSAYDYPPEVRFEIPQSDAAAYVRAAHFIDLAHADALCVQHEFGIYGGRAGSHVLGLLRRVHLPVVTTMHTVLEKPDDGQRRAFEGLAALSDKVVVMAEHARAILREVYRVEDDKIAVVPHGIPDVPYGDPEKHKERFGAAGRPVMLTFGLLSPNKGIEYAIGAMPAIAREHPGVVYIILGATHPNLLREGGESYRLQLERLARRLGVEKNVRFVNRYVSDAELREYIGGADIYVTPYLNEAQITSGTLAYCYGAGKAVVSTPYWHAAELLADGRGALVPFRDAAAIAREVNALLGDENRLAAVRQRAFAEGRRMLWPEVARAYTGVFASACDTRLPASRSPQLFGEHSHLPPWRFDHLLDLTDGTGILQHARYSVPSREHGYCTDDNARALLFAVLLEELEELSPELRRARAAYAGFLQDAFRGGRFRNFLSFARVWPEEQGSEDCHGRALWALGTTAARSKSAPLRAWADSLFAEALPAAESLTSPRAWAFALLGLRERQRAGLRQSGENAAKFLEARLLDLWRRVPSPGWPWFEEVLAYDNARLSQALVMSPDESARRAGLDSLRWLMARQTSEDGNFRPIGSNGFARKGEPAAEFDQQPLEAAAAIGACLAAHRATADPSWAAEARRAFDWFMGANDLDEALYDPATGGCRDALHADRANLNEGAESTLSFLLALAEMKASDNAEAAFARENHP